MISRASRGVLRLRHGLSSHSPSLRRGVVARMFSETGASASPWAATPSGPPDPIFGLAELYNKDSDANKVNLTLGAYRDENGKPWVLPVVEKAEKMVIESSKDMEYLPIAGSKKFLKQATKLVYGADNSVIKEDRVAALQTLSGTGALRIGFEFLTKFLDKPIPQVLVPSPTYANHFPIFAHSGHTTANYRYYDKNTNGLDFKGLIEDLKAAPDGSIIMLHAVAHNPTGVDPKAHEWAEISKVCKEKKFIPVFDCAYQGFASGDVDADALSVRTFVADGHQIMLCQSFAKNFGLYGHRAGALSFVCESADEKDRVNSQLKILARAAYSNPPLHGARIVETILCNNDLKAQWFSEVKQMATRIHTAREGLKAELVKQGSALNWDHITDQIGMFCYTGLDDSQCQKLIDEWHVYLLKSGRISMAGVTPSNTKYLAEAIHAVTQ